MIGADGAATLSVAGVTAINVSRDGKHVRFEAPCEEGRFTNAPKGPAIVEVQLAAFEAPREKRPNESITHSDTWFKQDHV